MSGSLHASTGGHESQGNPTIVMIHGAGGNRTVWAPQARHLAARGFDVLAFDLPGHGQSGGEACDSVEGYRDAVISELDARSIDTFALAGHSLGAMISMAIAAKIPDRVSHLALLGAGLQLLVADDLMEATRDDPPTAIDAIVDWGHSALTHVGGGQTPGLWMDGTDTAILRSEARAHPGSLHADFVASAAYSGARAASTIACPTLVISGKRDMMTPPKLGRAAAEAIDGAELLELDGCGHFMMTERPADICRALAMFYRS